MEITQTLSPATSDLTWADLDWDNTWDSEELDYLLDQAIAPHCTAFEFYDHNFNPGHEQLVYKVTTRIVIGRDKDGPILGTHTEKVRVPIHPEMTLHAIAHSFASEVRGIENNFLA